MVNGTLIWYYTICKREVWLMTHKIVPNQENSFIEVGRAMHENSFKRKKKEIMIGGVKFDVLENKKGNLIVGEIKKTSTFTESAALQLKYYLLTLKRMGIESTGELLFPSERKKKTIELTKEDISTLENIEKEILLLAEAESPLPPIWQKYCTHCAYNEFCWADNIEDENE